MISACPSSTPYCFDCFILSVCTNTKPCLEPFVFVYSLWFPAQHILVLRLREHTHASKHVTWQDKTMQASMDT